MSVSVTTMFAASGPAQVGILLTIVLLIGWVGYLVAANSKTGMPPGSEVELAPNRRPYLSDEELEGPKLDRSLTWALLLLGFISLALPAYWLKEPGRMRGAEVGFEHRAAERGKELFASTSDPEHPGFGCADCHGVDGSGGSTNFLITVPAGTEGNSGSEDKTVPVKWAVPALNTVLLRFSPEEVKQILVYGRPGTPMPAWGVEGGGAMNDQQITDLIAYVEELQISGDEAKKKAADAEVAAKAEATSGFDEGQWLFGEYCARCHTKGASYSLSYEEPGSLPGGGGSRGPNLRDGVTLRQFPTVAAHVDFVTTGSDNEIPYGAGGIGTGRMPGFGEMLSEEQIKAIVEYERSL